MEKENIPEPQGILKNGLQSLPRINPLLTSLPDTYQTDSKIIRRRVSFAPEVTLHKIDFVPQYHSDSYEAEEIKRRRETIAFIPSSQEQLSSSSDVADSHTSLGLDVLSDSSDDEENGSAPIQMEIPIPQESSFCMEDQDLQDLGLSKQVNREISHQEHSQEDEEDMELTENMSGSGNSNGSVTHSRVHSHPANLDESQNMISTSEKVNNQSLSNLNPSTLGIIKEESNLLEEGEEDEMEMELTQPVGGLKKIDHNDEPKDEDMELTQALGSINSNSVISNGNETNVGTTPTKSEFRDDSNLNNQTNVIVESTQDITMEETQTMGTIKELPEEVIPENTESTDLDMTQNNGKIHSLDLRDQTESTGDNMEKTVSKFEQSDSYKTNEYVPDDEKKHKLDDAIDFEAKLPKISTSTETAPLADVTNDSFDESSIMENPVSLTQFMNDIGIKFYNDLGIGSQNVNRISINLDNSIQQEYSLEDYNLAYLQIPSYELYDFTCNELTKNIEEGIKVFNKLDETTSESNPRLFKEYYETIPEAQLGMRSEFQLLKDYARQEAKKVWYEWRIQLYNNLVDEMTRIFQSLKEDKEKTVKALNKINEIFEVVKDKHTQLSNKLKIYKILISNSANIDQGELQRLHLEIVQTKQHIDKFKLEYSQQQEQLNELNETIHAKEMIIAKLNEQIFENKNILKNSKKYNMVEMRTIQLTFKLLENATGCKYLNIENDTLKFLYDDQVEVMMKLHESHRKIDFKFKQQYNKFHNGELFSLGSKFVDNFFKETDDDLIGKFHKFQILWANLKKLDFEVYKLSLLFPTQVIDNVVVVQYYQRAMKCKLELRFSITLGKEFKLLNSLMIKKIRSSASVESEKLVAIIKNECHGNMLLQNIETVSWEPKNPPNV